MPIPKEKVKFIELLENPSKLIYWFGWNENSLLNVPGIFGICSALWISFVRIYNLGIKPKESQLPSSTFSLFYNPY